jgi:hypothetical protein
LIWGVGFRGFAGSICLLKGEYALDELLMRPVFIFEIGHYETIRVKTGDVGQWQETNALTMC